MTLPTSRRRAVRVPALAAAALTMAAVLTGCGAGRNAETNLVRGTNDSASGRVGSVLLRNVYIAEPTESQFAVGTNATLYASLFDVTSSGDTLAGASTPAARSVVLRYDADGSGTQPVAKSIPLTAAQGSYSLELQGLTRPLRPAQFVPVTFTFAKAGSVELQVPVQTFSSPRPRPSGVGTHGGSEGEEPSSETGSEGSELSGDSGESHSGDGSGGAS